jgi:hypothetical protein
MRRGGALALPALLALLVAKEVGALGLKLQPSPRPPSVGDPPRVTDPRISATGGAWVGLSAPAGAAIYLGRFGGPTVALGRPAGAKGFQLRIPPDRAGLPWRLRVRSRTPITVCGLGRG